MRFGEGPLEYEHPMWFGGGSLGDGHPHDPYIEAVMEVLGDELGPDCETVYDADRMTAFLDLGGIDCDPDDPEPRAALLWSPQGGWLCGAWDGGRLEAVRTLTWAVVPAPVDVARAARARVAAYLLPLLPVSMDDTPETATAPLTPALRTAVQASHLDLETAGRLAYYAQSDVLE
ncbi:DUF6292 family protein [Streptomyces hundungensis]|uniref:DUF6292 family protein n=1 Tax=Streptomyces hundungensis TaxID=1077946 RepID=UPI0033C63F19